VTAHRLLSRRLAFVGAAIVVAALGACAVLTAQWTGLIGAPTTAAAAAAHTAAKQDNKRWAHGDNTLGALGAKFGLRIGTAVNTDALAKDAAYRQVLGTQFSTVTPENAMKWGIVEPKQGVYDWAPADKLVAFAQAHHQLVRGHNLVWFQELPDWLNKQYRSISPDALRTILHKHITDEVSRFKGKIWQWDVVNEAFADDGTLRDDMFLDKLGPGYIADAFRWAHDADPTAQLFYNDYNIEFSGAKSDAVYDFVKKLQKQGVPIDGVGFQGHFGTQFQLPDLQTNLQRFAKLGLNVAVTEVDVRTSMPVLAFEQSAQNAAYSQSLQACIAVRACISYTMWGFDDRYSWIPDSFPGQGSADIYDRNLNPKPQYDVLKQDLQLAADGAPVRTERGVR
jgi:endo-1,4-beta-xylanase